METMLLEDENEPTIAETVAFPSCQQKKSVLKVAQEK